MREYSDEFIDKMKDYAVLGLYPVQIAERMGLVGVERRRFIEDICDVKHPLYAEYATTKAHNREDMDAALNTSALCGDAKALRLAYELNQQDRVDQLKNDLFGIK